MAVADKFIMSDETAKGLVNGIKVGGFWSRVGIYLMLYVPVSLVLIFLLLLQTSPKNIPLTGNADVNFFGIIFLVAIPFILVELGIRSWRRKKGFSVNGNIAEELRQREVDLYVAREEKARGKLDNSSDTKDLNYWFGLLEKGAITQEEYEKKKMELLS